MKLYQKLARLVIAIKNCEQSGNTEWQAKHTEELERLTGLYFPSGSGFDAGCSVDIEGSSGDVLVIRAPWHRMDENGYYDGWLHFRVVVNPSLYAGFTLTITEETGTDDYSDVSLYVSDVFCNVLDMDI